MSLTKNDLQQIKNVVTEVIDEKVPKMIDEGIERKVPKMIEDAIDKKVPKMIEDAIDKKVPAMIQEGASEVFVQGFENYVIPYVDSKFNELKGEMDHRFEKMDIRFEKVDETFKKLNNNMDKHVLSLHERIDDSITLNDRYYYDCATKNEHKALITGVNRLESAL